MKMHISLVEPVNCPDELISLQIPVSMGPVKDVSNALAMSHTGSDIILDGIFLVLKPKELNISMHETRTSKESIVCEYIMVTCKIYPTFNQFLLKVDDCASQCGKEWFDSKNLSIVPYIRGDSINKEYL